MALISIIDDFSPLDDARLLARAEQLKPALFFQNCEPTGVFRPGIPGVLRPDQLPELALGKGESLCLDFGEHRVGSVTLELDCTGSHQDAPVFLCLRFAETLPELEEDPQSYDGWLSRSWIQEETVHVDLLPHRLALSRRYAFRYLRITVLDTSPKYKLVLRSACCRAQSAADWSRVQPRETGDPVLDRICAVSLKTLAECMQEEFEDGPKRDRRLWMGDLRLQALCNAVSFRNFDLVKRCLYLFAGSRFPDGRISANVFSQPKPAADDTFLFDYALMFPVALEEYLADTEDQEALEDLYEIAMEQIDYALSQVDEQGFLSPQAVKDCFIDWCDELDRAACAMGVVCFSLPYAAALAERRGDTARRDALNRRCAELRTAAQAHFWDENRGCFLSNGQLSCATQVWMTLGQVGSAQQRRSAMETAAALTDGPRMNSPYMHHYYVTALLEAGLRESAEEHLKEYWGSMLDAGADTFWECWDPEHPERSPYGGSVVNSFCHAWSCTPAYIVEKLLR